MTATAQLERKIYDKLIEYRYDPTGFMVDCLDVKREYLWSKMVEVAESVRDNQFTAVPAGHDVSKTYNAGRIAVWFKTCFQPSTVITTAPSDNQVRNQLWREIHAAYAGAKVPLGGNMTKMLWDVKPSKQTLEGIEPEYRGLWEKNFAIGFSTSPDTVSEHATKMQGWHNEWILVILDEACGIMRQIWRTVLDSLIVNERCKVLAIGNPTDPEGDFAQACKDPDWNVIPVSVKDTPNFIQGREVIPGLAGRSYEKRMRDKYGVGGNGYKYRVLGQFPEFLEGTFYGSRIAKAEQEGRIGHWPHETEAKVYTFADYGDIYTAILFVQFIQGRIQIIDYYYDNTGIGAPGYCKMMDAKPYIYKSHWAGPDLETSNRKSLATGQTIINTFAQLGYHIQCVDDHKFNDGIESVRGIFDKLYINEKTCKDLIIAAKRYRLRKNELLSTEDQTVYHDSPVKDASRHPMDALRHLARAFRYKELGEQDEILGYPGAIPEWQDRSGEGVEVGDDLTNIGM